MFNTAQLGGAVKILGTIAARSYGTYYTGASPNARRGRYTHFSRLTHRSHTTIQPHHRSSVRTERPDPSLRLAARPPLKAHRRQIRGRTEVTTEGTDNITMSPSTAPKDSDMVVLKPDKIGDADFANYFCTYGYLYHQKDMLEDQKRMTAYHDSVRLNPKQFKDKVVLDVGTGSGILAIWAAQCGARKVYAVEATYMAVHARKLVAANGLENVVEIIQSTVEEVELPEKVDVIISEWMGYFLLRESMFDSVIVARDKWLKPGGCMFPSHATMSIAPIRTGASVQKAADYEDSCRGWDEFVDDTKDHYGVDMSALTDTFDAEQREFFLNTSSWVDIHPSQLLGKASVICDWDLHTVTLEDIKNLDVPFDLRVTENGPSGPSEVGAFAGWFDVSFKGSKENPNETDVELTTAPGANGATHWGQQAFYLSPGISAADGAVIEGRLEMQRKKENQRLYDVRLTWRQGDGDTMNDAVGERQNVWHIE